MVRLTRLHGDQFFLNEDRIERIEPHPDTTITTIAGNCYTVAEPVEEVVAAVREAKAAVLALAQMMASGQYPGRLRALDTPGEL